MTKKNHDHRRVINRGASTQLREWMMAGGSGTIMDIAAASGVNRHTVDMCLLRWRASRDAEVVDSKLVPDRYGRLTGLAHVWAWVGVQEPAENVDVVTLALRRRTPLEAAWAARQ